MAPISEEEDGEGWTPIECAWKQGHWAVADFLLSRTGVLPRPDAAPYDPAAPLSDQVAQSVQVSLKNLQVTSVDALLLHGPLETHERTMEAWRAMERQVELGFVTQLGISNLHDVRRFERIYEEAAVKPRVLQNRFSPQLGPRSASKLPVRVDATSPRPRRS